MTEAVLIKLLGLVGLALFAFGIWLFRKGRGIEQKARHEYGTKSAIIFGNHFPRSKSISGLEPHSLKPLAYLCVIVGVVFLLIFASSLF